MAGTPNPSKKSRRGFASMTPEKRSQISGLAGRKAHALGRAHQYTHDEAVEAGSKGGKAKSSKPKAGSQKRKTAPKVPLSLRLDQDTIERLRNAVWHLGRGMTVTSVIEEAMEQAARELEKQNGGKPFPVRVTPLSEPRRAQKDS